MAVAVEMPAIQPPVHGGANVHQRAGQIGNITVAVIEDDTLVRGGICAILRRWGYEVIEGAGMEDILDIIIDAPPIDVIIADYRLRDRATGVEAVVIIRKVSAVPPPGIILTGDPDPGIEADVERHGLTLLRKPVEPEVLRSAIDEAVLGGNPWMRS
jgi:CheY-like chemotaxis protein